MPNYSSIPANEGTPERRAQPLMAKSPSKLLQLERSLLIALINLAGAEQLQEEQLQGWLAAWCSIPALSHWNPGRSHGSVTVPE